MSPWLIAIVVLGATIWGLIVSFLVLFLWVCRVSEHMDE